MKAHMQPGRRRNSRSAKAISLLVAVIMIFTVMCEVSFSAVGSAPADSFADPAPVRPAVGTNATLVDIELTGFKGSRNEYFRIPLQQEFDPDTFVYDMEVDVKQFPASDRCFYVKPVAFDESAIVSINGTVHDYNVPYRLELEGIPFGEAPKEFKCEIVVTSANGSAENTYTLNVTCADLNDKVQVRTLEENLEGEVKTGVYHISSVNGFVTAEDCYLFIGKDKAMVFDALNGGAPGVRRGGDLVAAIYDMLKTKFGVEDPDKFPIDVVVTHNNGDHYGLVNITNVQKGEEDKLLSGRGKGNGTVYWPLSDAGPVSDALWNDPNTDIKMLAVGDTLLGPDFGKGPLKFETHAVYCHTVGHMLFLYDNDKDGQCSDNYLISGDSVGQGYFVFNFGNGKPIVPVFSEYMERLWTRVKKLSNLHMLVGHAWQERFDSRGQTGLSLVEDMYIASKIILENPYIGAFTTNPPRDDVIPYHRKFAYGFAGLWYNDYGIVDANGNKIEVSPAGLLSLVVAENNPRRNMITAFNPLTTAYNVVVPDADPLYLMPESFTEGADIAVTLNGSAVPLTDIPFGKDGYALSIKPAGQGSGVGGTGFSGFNVVEVEVTEGYASMVYTVNIAVSSSAVDAKNARLIPADITEEVYDIPTQPEVVIPEGGSVLNNIMISSYKGGRLEPYRIKLDEPIDVMTWEKFDYTAAMDYGSRTSDVVYIVPETTNTEATYTINGEKCQFPIPYRYQVKEGANEFKIVVSEEGGASSTYNLTINATPLWTGYTTHEIESGVWRIQDASGFVTNEDMYLFVGEDKAMLFDSGMGEGNLREIVDGIVGDPLLPLEVVVTHAHGDHYGKVREFGDAKVYWPVKDASAVPVNYDTSKYIYIDDGDILAGPKIDGTPMMFESIVVTGHTIGSTVFLYDNKAQELKENSYLVTSDAAGQGSYVFNFGTNKPAVESYYRDLLKLESKIAKFADGFYSKGRKVSFDDVDGLYFMTGHSWQEDASMMLMYEPSWEEPMPMQKLVGIQNVRDMRMSAEGVLNGTLKGRPYTRIAGDVVEPLRMLSYRQPELWYNGWDLTPAPASLEYLDVFSTAQYRSLVRPNFNSYTEDYTAAIKKGEVLTVYAEPFAVSASVKINGTDVDAEEKIKIDTKDIGEIVVEVLEGGAARTYTVELVPSGLGAVETENGSVVGLTTYGVGGTTADNAVTTFKAIPFAAPPVGENRWREPQPAQNWRGVKEANKYAPMAPQVLSAADHWGPEFNYEYFFNEANMNEDCLYVNVSTQATDESVAADKRPVFVWFHGGASMHGFSYEPEFSPEELAKKGVVVVTAPYRVGVFGYYVSDELAAEQGGTSGNYGFLDQVAALKWVQANIAKFGGDPANVTIGGQSAGASAVMQHLASDASKGLFKNAIVQSSLNPVSATADYREGVALSEKFMADRGFGDMSLAELRGLSTEDFFDYGIDRSPESAMKAGYYGQGFGFKIGGHGITRQPADVFFTKGALDGINIMFGSNDGESTPGYMDGLTPMDDFLEKNKAMYGPLYDKYNFEAMFPTGGDAVKAREQDLARDSETRLANAKLFAEVSSAGKLHNNKMYQYYFSFWAPGRNFEYKKAWHSGELWYVFNSMRDIPQQRRWTDEDREMADIVSSYWANFMKTGDPNGSGLFAWPEVNATNQFLRIGGGREVVFSAHKYLYEGTELANRDMLLREHAINTNGLGNLVK